MVNRVNFEEITEESTDKDLQRIAKYHKAYKYLEQFAQDEEYIVFID